VMLGLATTAAAMSVGEVAKFFGGAEHAGVSTSESATTVAGVHKDVVLESQPTENMMRAATGGVNEGPGTPWLEEELAAAKELPATDRDRMEEYLIKLNQGGTIQGGTVNEELLKQRAQEAFAQYNLTGKVPEVTGVTETVKGAVDADAAMEQSNASNMADNPTQEGMTYTNDEMNAIMEQSNASSMADNPLSQRFGGIEIAANGNGLLTVGAGSSINRELADFLEQNPKQVLNDMSGWSNERVSSLVEQANQMTDTGSAEYKSVIHELSGIRADVISREFMTDNPSIDLGTIEPNTDFELKFTELEGGKTDISITEVDKPHIVPTHEKIVFDNEAGTSEAPTLGEEGNVEAKVAQTTEAASDTGTEGSVAKEALNNSGESSHFEGMTESDVLKELGGNREFKLAVAEQMRETFGASNLTNTLQNVAPSDMNFYLSEGNMGVEKAAVVGLRDRAITAFGESGNPRPGVKVGEYFTRIFAKAVHEGKVKDVFPSSKFSE